MNAVCALVKSYGAGPFAEDGLSNGSHTMLKLCKNTGPVGNRKTADVRTQDLREEMKKLLGNLNGRGVRLQVNLQVFDYSGSKLEADMTGACLEQCHVHTYRSERNMASGTHRDSTRM